MHRCMSYAALTLAGFLNAVMIMEQVCHLCMSRLLGPVGFRVSLSTTVWDFRDP